MPFDHAKAAEIAKQRGMTHQQVADAMDAKRALVSRLLAGDRPNPSLETVERIAKALKVPLVTLVTENRKSAD